MVSRRESLRGTAGGLPSNLCKSIDLARLGIDDGRERSWPCAAAALTGGFMSTFFRALEQAEQDRARRHPTALSEPASERSPAFSSESRKGLEQLRLLFNYAKFDTGLYITVGMIFATALAFEPAVFKFHRGFLSLAVGFICLAGIAAGIIASRCAHFTSQSELWAAKFGPFRWSCLKGESWTYVQHFCFGIALIAAVLSVLMGHGKWLPIAVCTP